MTGCLLPRRRPDFTNSCASGGNKPRFAAYLGRMARGPIAKRRCRAGLTFFRRAFNFRQAFNFRRAPRGGPMSPSPFSRLCAAVTGALAIIAFMVAPAQAAEDA